MLRLDTTPVQGDLEGNYQKLEALVGWYFRDVDISSHLDMLKSYKEDYTTSYATYLGFLRAPAAKGNHHAFEGGLVYHLLEMWQIWLRIRPLIHDQDEAARIFVSDERILKAIIYHDLHKAHKTFLCVSADPWQTDYANDLTDQIMTNDTKTLWMLSQSCIPIDEQQMNALIQAEGGYSPIKPKQATVLAKTAYLLDEMSGNILARTKARTYLELRKPIA